MTPTVGWCIYYIAHLLAATNPAFFGHWVYPTGVGSCARWKTNLEWVVLCGTNGAVVVVVVAAVDGCVAASVLKMHGSQATSFGSRCFHQ